MRARTKEWLTITFVSLLWAVSLRVTIVVTCVGHDRPLLPWERPDPPLEWEPELAVLLSDAETEMRFRIARTERDFPYEGHAWHRAKQKWQDANLSDYDFVLASTCLCDPELQHPRKVVVRDRRVSRVRYVDVVGMETPEGAPQGMTIEEVFEKVWSIHRSDVSSLTIRYDPVYGFPRTVSVNEEKGPLDGEWTMTIRDFRVRDLPLGVGWMNRRPVEDEIVAGRGGSTRSGAVNRPTGTTRSSLTAEPHVTRPETAPSPAS